MDKQQIKLLYWVLGFTLICGFLVMLGSYPLLDIDETRYVNMAREMFNTKDYLTLYLNGDFFFEKPPLYFWVECISFKIFGVISEFTARLPIVLLSLLPAGLLFSLCRKVKGEVFAIISTATLLTSLEYMFLTKIAILDSIFTSFVVSSVLCYFYTSYVSEKNKIYFWILTYVFSALAVLTKGIPGMAISMLVITVSTVIFKTYKDTFKYLWGIVSFLIITLPWHLLMLKMHGSLFFDEYIIKHHILRFLGSEVIHRTQPWYFYILTLLWGLFPHVFVLFSQITKTKEINFKDKFLTLNFIALMSILVFFSLSGAKLITYILPIYPFFAVIIGNFWTNYIQNTDKNVEISLIVLNSFLTISVVLMCFVAFVMQSDVYVNFQKVQVISLIILIPFVVLNWIFVVKNLKLNIFMSIVIMMALLSGILTPLIYEFNYTFGQNDIMRFAKIAKDKNYTISTYKTGVKYALLYYGNQSKVAFPTWDNPSWLEKELKKDKHIVIIRNKEIKNLPVRIVKKGIKYSIIEGLNNEK